jgi:uncharacterized protein
MSSVLSSYNSSSLLIRIAVFAAVLAVVIQTAPGRPGSWPSPSTTTILDDAEKETLMIEGVLVSDGKDGCDFKTVRFVGGDGHTPLSGRLYVPPTHPKSSVAAGEGRSGGSSSVAVIVMAHGIGLVQGFHPIQVFQKLFVDRGGYAVLTFDYATFGQSDGSPRHLVRPTLHIQDIEAAITMLRCDKITTRFNIDPSRIGLWGTSFAGGHQLVVAADAEQQHRKQKQSTALHGQRKRNHIKAVVSIVPHLASGGESVLGGLVERPVMITQGVLQFLHFIPKWIVWQFLFPSNPWYIPLAGQPGSCAIMQNPGDKEGYLSLVQKEHEWDNTSNHWENAADGASAFHALLYRPLSRVHEIITTPTLLIGAQNDTLCPAKYIERIQYKSNVKNNPNVESIILKDHGHFDIYHDQTLQQILDATIDFYNRHL